MICKLYILFFSLCLICSWLVIFSKNAIYSLLFLILCICNISAIGFLLNFQVLPIFLIIVYVGATAVLFLFVIFMLNTNLMENKPQNIYILPVYFFLFLLFSLQTFFILRLEIITLIQYSFLDNILVYDYIQNFTINFSNFSNYLQDNNLRYLGHFLFFEYCFHVMLMGFLLLFALIGSINITLQKKFNLKIQNVYCQTLHNFNNVLTHYI